jgi:hypothetical protein
MRILQVGDYPVQLIMRWLFGDHWRFLTASMFRHILQTVPSVKLEQSNLKQILSKDLDHWKSCCFNGMTKILNGNTNVSLIQH